MSDFAAVWVRAVVIVRLQVTPVVPTITCTCTVPLTRCIRATLTVRHGTLKRNNENICQSRTFPFMNLFSQGNVGEFSWQQKTRSNLDFSAGDGGPAVYSCMWGHKIKVWEHIRYANLLRVPHRVIQFSLLFLIHTSIRYKLFMKEFYLQQIMNHKVPGMSDCLEVSEQLWVQIKWT